MRILILLVLLCLVAPVRAQNYAIEELPAPPGGESRAVALNARGDVCGAVYPVNGHTRAALWLVGRGLRWLGPDTEFDTRAVDLNDRLQVVIQSDEPGNPGLLWDLGKTGNLAARPLAVNNAGQVLYEPPATGIQWVALSDQGDRLGATWDGPLLRPAGSSTLTALVDQSPPELSRNESYRPVALNNRGAVLLNRVEEILAVNGGAFLWQDGALASLGAPLLLGRGLNDTGAVVGTVGANETDFARGHAFLWARATGAVLLQPRLTNGAGWLLIEAVAINSAGQIAGNGFLNGQIRAFRLTPTRVQVSGVNPH